MEVVAGFQVRNRTDSILPPIYGWQRTGARAVLAAAGGFVIVFLPFIVHGTFLETINAIFRSTFGGEPFVSCNACNFWWLTTGGEGYRVADSTTLLGFLSLRRLGLAAFLAANFLAFWKLRRPSHERSRLSKASTRC